MRVMSHFARNSFLLLFITACSSVEVDEASSGIPGSIAEASSGSTGGGTCTPGGASVNFAITLPAGGPPQSCNVNAAEDDSIVGEVTDSGASSLSVNTCPPTADCSATETVYSVQVSGDAPALAIPKGAFVRIHTQSGGGCRVVISNEALWAGAPNPVPGERLWFYLDEPDDLSQQPAPPAEVPFTFKEEKVCERSTGQLPQSVFSLQLGDRADAGNTLTLVEGQMEPTWKVGGQVLRVKDVVSHSQGLTNDEHYIGLWAATP
jgi:hypothetical protein